VGLDNVLVDVTALPSSSNYARNFHNHLSDWSRDSSVAISTGYGLEDRGGREFESRKGKKFLLPHIVQTGSGVHPTSYEMGTGGKAAGA
jgi:hypothetical protein